MTRMDGGLLVGIGFLQAWLNKETLLRQKFELGHVSTMFPRLADRGNAVAATKHVSKLVQKHFLLPHQCIQV